MHKFPQGQHKPLNVTQKGNLRIYAGLGWDPSTNTTKVDKIQTAIGLKKSYHDLDLSCLLYDQDNILIEEISIACNNTVAQNGAVFHSGDNEEGLGDGDDEQISVELQKISPTVHHIIFQVTIKSGHTFNQIASPEVHLSDGYSDHRFLHVDLNAIEGNNAAAYLFTHIYRNNDEWMMHHIGQFLSSASEIKNAIEKHLNMGFTPTS